jgi:Cu/Ag efflux protein CusF
MERIGGKIDGQKAALKLGIHEPPGSFHYNRLFLAMMKMMKRRAVLLSVAAVVLAGCGAKEQAQEQGKRYPMQGEVKAIDPAGKTANINAGKIEGWMEAMTMEYPVKPDAELAKLHVGDKIQATVVVNDQKYYVTDVKVLSKQ